MANEPAALPLTVHIEPRGDTVVALCKGRLMSSTGELLYKPIAELLPHHKRIVLDVAGLTQMDSMGLGMLVRLAVSARSKGCDLQLLHLGGRVRDLLILTNLLSVFTIVGEHGIKIG
jgi:anti-anti-sigma factor